MHIGDFFSAEHYYPKGYAYLWNADVLWLHVVSDSLIFISFMIIPGVLLFHLHKTQVTLRRWMATMFALFIAFAGITHLANIITIWHPYYGAEGVLKAVTAAISVATAFLIIPVATKLFGLKGNLNGKGDETTDKNP